MKTSGLSVLLNYGLVLEAVVSNIEEGGAVFLRVAHHNDHFVVVGGDKEIASLPIGARVRVTPRGVDPVSDIVVVRKSCVSDRVEGFLHRQIRRMFRKR